jgi:uncharacterized protein (TIGR03437 family)
MLKTIRLLPAALVLLPGTLLAYSTGPDPRLSGAPGDQTCVICHSGTSLNGGGGSAALASSAGTSYTPGQPQIFTLTINDPKARAYGFQITARLVSDLVNGQAGDFTAGPSQLVLCNDGTPKGASGCASDIAVQFIEHHSPSQSNTITVNWTPPSSNAGPVTIYAAANAANGDRNDTGDHIYTAMLQLTQLDITPKPAIQTGGVVSATAFQPGGIAPGTWIEIYGSSLSNTTRSWQASDFNGNTAPASLDGVSVTIGGKNAYVAYVSPGQVNAQAPDGIPIGSGVPLVLTNGASQSDAYSLQTSDTAPALLAPNSFAVNGKQYVAAMLPPNDSGQTIFAAAAGAIPGVATRPAKAGEVVTLYGIGFGAVHPAVSAGTIATEASPLDASATIFFGQTAAKILYAGAAPGLVGLYQFNVQVPSLAPGDSPLNVQIGGSVLKGTEYVTTQ